MRNTIWPNDIIRAATQKSLVLFVGAGVSASTRNDLGDTPPNWSTLLQLLAQAIRLSDTERQTFDSLERSGRLLDAAELLRFNASETGHTADLAKALRDAVQGPKRHPFSASDWHTTIGNINPSVIVTTNYDKILENADGLDYMVATHTSEDVDSLIRSNEPTIIKLHGTVDEPSKTILTRSDYARLHKEGSLALNVVRALMWTRTFLFVGYSLSDPDLQVLLQDVFAARSNHNVNPHYILTSDKSPAYDRAALQYCYGISSITYESDLGDFGLSALQELGQHVSETPPPEY